MILIALLLFLAMFVLMPLLFADLMATALMKLHLDPSTAVILVVGIIFGSLINIPVKHIVRKDTIAVHPLAVLGLGGLLPRLVRFQNETIIAVNVGGCVIPLGIAIYEIVHAISQGGARAVIALAIAIGANVAVCFFLAKPVQDVGITMPTFVPAIVAALSASMVYPEMAPPIAFAAGALGPIVGADLMHLRDIAGLTTGMASIGGAGTFDGIVLSCIVAAYLA